MELFWIAKTEADRHCYQIAAYVCGEQPYAELIEEARTLARYRMDFSSLGLHDEPTFLGTPVYFDATMPRDAVRTILKFRCEMHRKGERP